MALRDVCSLHVFAECQEARLLAHCGDLCARAAVGLSASTHQCCEFVEIHVRRSRHALRAQLEDAPPRHAPRWSDVDEAVEAPWSDERGVLC